MKRVLFLLVAAGILTSCASSHDLKDGPNTLGGGYRVEEVSPGLFRILAKTNVAQMEAPKTARRSWQKRAELACEGSAYLELNVREYSYENIPQYRAFRYVVTAKEGFALCETSQLSESEAAAVIVSLNPDGGTLPVH